MAGIYLHIPFCKTRCIYCDFYSTTRSEQATAYVEALCKELRLRRDYLQGEPIRTVYFGGGTPSQLTRPHFEQIFQTLQEEYDLSGCEEITLEANPDDLTEEYAAMLTDLPFNRLSMGIQTFHEDTLRLLKRRHTACQALDAVTRARAHGFQNISIDLIYGLPGETDQRWESDLSQAISLGVEHISAYHLIYEEGTPLYQLREEHRVEEVDEDSSLKWFTQLMDRLGEAGYEHYEISNFCRPGYASRHNASYWQGIPYLGCGPSAHSYNRQSREWNVASLTHYMKALQQGQRDFEQEELDLTTRYNEFIMTSLRTSQGIYLPKLYTDFGKELADYCQKLAFPYLQQDKLKIENQFLKLTRKGLFISDSIMSDLMKISE